MKQTWHRAYLRSKIFLLSTGYNPSVPHW